MATPIGNNNYHIQLTHENDLKDRDYLGVTVLDNKVKKSWYCDYRTKPKAKLPHHYLKNNTSEIARMLQKHSRKSTGFIQQLVEKLDKIEPIIVPDSVSPIQDPKDEAQVIKKLEKLTNEELYNMGILLNLAEEDKDGQRKQYDPRELNIEGRDYADDEMLTFNKRLVKEEYLAIIIHALSNR